MDNTRRPPQSFEGISNMTLGQYVALVRTADQMLPEDDADSAIVELAANILPLGRADQLTFEDAEHLLTVVSWMHDLCWMLYERTGIRLEKFGPAGSGPWHPGSKGPELDFVLVRSGDFPVKDFERLLSVARKAQAFPAIGGGN